MTIKHKQYNELGDPAPTAWGWSISSLALFLMLVCMLWGQLAATGLRYARLQESFARLARDGKNLQALLADQRFDPIFEQHSDAFKTLIPVITFVNHGDLGHALETLQRKDAPRHPLLLRLQTRLEELANADSDYATASEEEAASSGLRDSLINNYQDILEQLFHSLVGTDVPSDLPPLGGFYEKGVLKGLPLVTGIPDNVTSLEMLQSYARKYREGNDKERRMFERMIEPLQKRCEMLKPQIEDFLSRSKTRQSKMKSLASSRGSSIEEAKIILVKVIVEFTRVVVSPSLIRAYSQFTAILDPFGFDLPELRIG